MYNKTIKIHFWLGTEAELIKVLPVMNSLQEKGLEFGIIATGQNPVLKSHLLKTLNQNPPAIELSEGPRKKTTFSLLLWFFRLLLISIKTVPASDSGDILLVHGDTISTLAGAFVGSMKKYKIGHIEAGLRSFNYLNPFPEEIDRVLTSRLVDYHYCPNADAAKNINNRNGSEIIDTKYNTLIDSLLISRQRKIEIKDLPSRYFVFVLHRQENLFDKEFVRKIMGHITKQSKHLHCILILHEITERTLQELGLLAEIKQNPSITCLPRQDYFKFMKILSTAEFLVTDGGSNQEESFYLGLPCLVLREVTERNEGFGENVVLGKNKWDVVENFFLKFQELRKTPLNPMIHPSDIITEHLRSVLTVVVAK